MTTSDVIVSPRVKVNSSKLKHCLMLYGVAKEPVNILNPKTQHFHPVIQYRCQLLSKENLKLKGETFINRQGRLFYICRSCLVTA